ncbi:MAG: MmcB family DNA repair protein [Bacillota bacterium]
MKVKSQDITRALAKKHHQDFYLTEVKNGSTWYNKAMVRMDAMAIKKSWANPCITGYEVKVDRHDFLNDVKWPAYREFCHQLSFVCPKGLIQPEELPEDIGLIWFNTETEFLYTKKKAKYREIECPGDMFYYILLSRVDNDRYPFYSSKREYLEDYIRDKENKRELARAVRTKMANEIVGLRQEVEGLKREIDRKEYESTQFEIIRKILLAAGIRTSRWSLEEDLKSALGAGMDPRMKRLIDDIKNDANQLHALLKKDDVSEEVIV